MVKEMFDNVIQQIRQLINDQIRKCEAKDSKTPAVCSDISRIECRHLISSQAVVLVGGFSSCGYLFTTLKEEHQGRSKIYKSAGTKP
jgi:hypothetical protein